MKEIMSESNIGISFIGSKDLLEKKPTYLTKKSELGKYNKIKKNNSLLNLIFQKDEKNEVFLLSTACSGKSSALNILTFDEKSVDYNLITSYMYSNLIQLFYDMYRVLKKITFV